MQFFFEGEGHDETSFRKTNLAREKDKWARGKFEKAETNQTLAESSTQNLVSHGIQPGRRCGGGLRVWRVWVQEEGTPQAS